VEVQYLPAYDAAGRVFAVAFVALDVTDRKHAEEAILELNAGLERRVAERTAQLQSINKELEAFSYSVSHDLRAPLRSIDGFSKAVLEDYSHLLDAEGQDYLRSIRTASQRMGQLIDDLLKLSRGDAGRNAARAGKPGRTGAGHCRGTAPGRTRPPGNFHRGPRPARAGRP
jgi:signal transduction histidine kinase